MKTTWQLANAIGGYTACVVWDDHEERRRLGIGDGPEPTIFFDQDEAEWLCIQIATALGKFR